MRTRVSWICALASLAIWSAAHAAAPPLLPLQGVLTDADGVPLAAAVSLRFSLHTAETAGSEVWYETQSVTPVDGLFAAYLGQGTGSTMTLATFRDQGELWLEVKVGNDEPMARVRLASVAYAGFAEYCGNVPAHSHPASELPAGVVIGAQACSGSDKVRAVAASGAIVCSPDLGTGADTLGQLNCTSGQTVKWNGSLWGCAADDNSGGTITAVNAGGGLSGSTVGTVATLGLSSSCAAGDVLRYSGAAWQCSPAVQALTTPAAGGLAFTTTGATYNLTLKAGCQNGQVLKYNTGTSTWDCAADGNSGGDVTDVLVAAGGGLAVTSSGGPQPTLALQACTTTGQVLKYTVGTGWDCAADDNSGDITAVNTPNGGGLTGGVAAGAANLSLVSCSANQILRSAGATWGCVDSITAANTPATGGLAGGGTAGALSLKLKDCPGGQVLKSVGTGWDCAADDNAGGDITAVNTPNGSGLGGGSTSGAVTLSLLACGNNQALRDVAGAWACVDDITAVNTPTAGGLTGGGSSGALGIGLRTCSAGQTLVYNTGTGWNCGSELHVGDVVSVAAAAGGGVSIGGTAANPTVGLTTTGCAEGEVMTYAGGTWACATAGDPVVGNEVVGPADGTLTLTGSGTAVDPYRLALNLTHANRWTGLQQFADSLAVFETGNTTQTLGLWAGTGAGELAVNGRRALRLEAAAQPVQQAPGLIGGFFGNAVHDSAVGATIAGGGSDTQVNTVSDRYGVVGGGLDNRAGDDDGNPDNAPAATVAGGWANRASAAYAVVSGGSTNLASGAGSAVPGGADNVASGDYGFAAGYRAKAAENGCFVWGDSSTADVSCSVANQFVARATGGFTLATNAALTTGCSIAAGGGSWSCTSDRAAKRDFEPVDARGVLARVAALPISTWRFKTEVSGARHMGPMAQDFHAAFALGDSDRAIGAVDADGVALAAIQGLNQADGELRAENAQLRTRLHTLEQRLARLEQTQPARSGPATFGWGAFGLLVAGGVVVARRRRGH
jgi:hypothetical protein